MVSIDHAFAYAGARSVLASQWRLHSAGAAELTRRFFAARDEDPAKSRAELLREARIGMIDEGVFRDDAGDATFSYAHPLFWAGYALVGDGRGSMR